MRNRVLVVGLVVLAVQLVAGTIAVGSVWAQVRGWGSPGWGMMGGGWQRGPTSDGLRGWGSPGWGMMGGGWQSGPTSSGVGGWCGASYVPGQGRIESLAEAEAAVQEYVRAQGYTGLKVEEVMEFEDNYYAIAEERDSGIGAFEVLVDRDSGAVRPEPGPNMMWNAKYSPMGGSGMMGGFSSGQMTVTAAEAQDIGQQWLDANLPGRTAGESDAFYGYYTLHFLKDGKVDGMLSVHGSTGAVWYHSWHGGFVAMIEEG